MDRKICYPTTEWIIFLKKNIEYKIDKQCKFGRKPPTVLAYKHCTYYLFNRGKYQWRWRCILLLVAFFYYGLQLKQIKIIISFHAGLILLKNSLLRFSPKDAMCRKYICTACALIHCKYNSFARKNKWN